MIKRFWDAITLRIKIGFLYLIFALSRVEMQTLRFFGNKDSFGGVITRFAYRSALLEKLHQGKHDEKYVQQFYEILKKADAFMKKSSPKTIAISADKYAKTMGKQDVDGIKHDHFGFFDENHKYYGKTMDEVIELELEERRTKDDNFKLIQVVNNKPIEVGFSDIGEVVKEVKDKEGNVKYVVDDQHKTSKKYRFPVQIIRGDEKCVNKIEELSEFLHIKFIGFEHRRFEFFVPLKFKTHEFDDDSKVIKDILNVKEIFIKDQYGEFTGFRVNKFVKRFKHNDLYEVFRFDGIEMEKINNN